MTAAKEKLLAWLSTSGSSNTLKGFYFFKFKKEKSKSEELEGRPVYKGMSKMTKKEFARNMQKELLQGRKTHIIPLF